MEQGNGHFNVMENRMQCGGLRYKSKVPRARGAHPQRPDYADCTIPTPLKRDILLSPRDHQPSGKEYQSSNRNRQPSHKDYHQSPRDHSPSLRNHHSLPRDHNFSPKDYPPPPRDRNPSPRDHSPSPRNHYTLTRDSHSVPRDHNPLPRDYNPSPRYPNPLPRDHNPPPRYPNPPPRDHNPQPTGDHYSSLRDYNPSPRDHQGMLGLGDTDEQKEWRQLVGQRVCISGVKQGTLRYFGRTKFAQGHWCGVELDEPVGKHDGTVGGVVYFACRPNHGIFAPVGKVSKLNDTWDSDETSKPSNLGSTWRTESVRQELTSHVHQRQPGWEYSMEEESSEKKYIRNSISEPVFIQENAKPVMPRGSESFSFERRGPSKNFAKQSSSVKISSSSRSLSKYGYVKNNQYLSSNVITLSENARELQKQQFSNGSGQNSGLTAALEEYEQFLRTPTNSGQASPMSSETAVAKRFNEKPFYDYGKMPDAFLNAFQSRDFSDFEDEVDNDDQMSVDYDESLGILTPSQMKDLTLGTDFPTSLTDLRGLDFPSSESFDDINDLPEDEQVHDVSVFHVSEPSTTRSMEITKQNGSNNYNQNFKVTDEENVHVNSTDKFLSSISQKDCERPHIDLQFASTASEEFNFNSTDSYKRTYNVNELSGTSITCLDISTDGAEKNSDKYKSFSKEESSNLCLIRNSSELHTSVSTTACSALEHTLMEVDQKAVICVKSGGKPIDMVNSEEKSRQNESFLSTELEINTTLKEKLTVSWDDCLPRDSECIFPHVERPESVYTVGSSDTGFQEDGELEGDAGMTTSMDSTDETKRFSLASRDSCIVSDEVDVYKIAESNSTSGYSTGLSDSCCNDRAEDDLSSKPLTDEEIQDSVEHCDSEDAFSFQENSLGKDGDLMNMETSEVTTENVTAVVNNDSASDALCETMVEDSTLTDINELLMSPEDSGKTTKSPVEVKEMEVVTEQQPVKEVTPQEKTDSSSVTNSQALSTPERKPNTTRTRAGASTRNVSTSGATRASRMTKEEDIDKRRQQAVVPKSPKKNVMSKIKAMIEATSCKSAGRSSSSSKTETEQPIVTRRTVSAPKKSRWEAVTSKIAASLAEEKTKPKTRREIRSRVDTNLTSARQQQVACKSPKLDSCRASNYGDGSMSPPVSVCSRDRRALADKNSAPSSVREGRTNLSRDSKQRPKSPRQLHRLLSLMAGCAPVCRMTYVIATPPGPGRITSRSASPVAASESSTASISLNSHKSKIAHWKGSNSTIASSVPPPPISKRPPPIASTKATSVARSAPGARTINKKPPTVPKIRITPSERSQSPAATARNEKSKRLSRTNKEHGGVGRAGTHLTSKQPVRPPMWLSKAELTQEIQRLGTLCEARTKELNRLKMETKHVTVGFDAFAALFKYMVDDVKGLSVPQLSEELKKTLKQLELAKQDLAYYEREVEEMKAHHCQELNDLSNKLFEVFQGEVTELGTKHQEEINRMKIEHEQQLKATSETYEAGYEETQASHEAALMKLQQELITQREELQLFHEKELVELEEKHSQSTKTLQEHIEQLQKKCAELKHHSLGMEDAMRKDTDSKLQWVTSRKGDLEKEVESLKAVLEMKNKELHTLRVQNLEMEKQLEELPLAREKIKMLSARAEDLEALMIEKTRVERKLSNENQTIRDTYEKESKVNKRLSMENEELQWRLRQAEQSIISGSFTEVAESAEETENGALSPAKSPHQMSRSVFFTFVDKDNVSSPRSQYKKITPGFSSGYKTSPSKSSRNRGLSEPMQPSSVSTPKKGVKTSLKQKRQRANTNADNGGNQSFASSMVSSVGSECSVFDQKEGILEEHQEQIIETLEILREQRCSEEKDESSDSWQNGENLGDTIAMQQEQNREHLLEEPLADVSCQKEFTEGLVEQCSKFLALDCEKMRFSENSPEIASEPMTPSDISDASCQKELSGGLVEQCAKFLDLGSEKIKFESSPETGSEPITPSDKWQDEGARNGSFNRDEMSRSAEFSDPKTYYHMTFPVLKEAGAAECDGEDKAVGHDITTAQATHSIVESSVKVDSCVVHVSKEVSSEVTNLSLQGNGALRFTEKVTQENALVQSCHSTRESECNLQSREKNRWRTM